MASEKAGVLGYYLLMRISEGLSQATYSKSKEKLLFKEGTLVNVV